MSNPNQNRTFTPHFGAVSVHRGDGRVWNPSDRRPDGPYCIAATSDGGCPKPALEGELCSYHNETLS